MKNKFVKISLFIATSLFWSSATHGSPHCQNNQDLEALSALYEDFAITASNQDSEGHLATFTRKFAPLNIIYKTENGPQLNQRSGNWWARVIARKPENYQLVISDTEYFLEGDIAFSSAHFQQMEGESPDGYGNDLFTYLKTDNGWKISSLNNTYVAEDWVDNNTTSLLTPKEIKRKLTQLSKAIKKSDSEQFLQLFTKPSVPFYSTATFKKTGLTDKEQNAQFFADQMATSNSFAFYRPINTKVRIFDDYTAAAHGAYIEFNNGKITKGRQITIFVADNEGSWKIASVWKSLQDTKRLPKHP